MGTTWLNDGGVWKSAKSIYVKDGGVWKSAIPWVKEGGVWKSAHTSTLDDGLMLAQLYELNFSYSMDGLYDYPWSIPNGQSFSIMCVSSGSTLTKVRLDVIDLNSNIGSTATGFTFSYWVKIDFHPTSNVYPESFIVEVLSLSSCTTVLGQTVSISPGMEYRYLYNTEADSDSIWGQANSLSFPWSNNDYIHVCCVIDLENGEQRYYHQGSLWYQRANDYTLDPGDYISEYNQNSWNPNLFAMQGDLNGQTATCSLKNMRVWDRPLTSSEVDDLYFRGPDWLDLA